MAKWIKSVTVMMHNYGIDGFQAEELHIETYPSTRTLFDERGDALEEITYTKEGETESRFVRSYDAKGVLSEELYYSGEDLTDRHTFEYGADGKLTKEFRHYLDGSHDTITYHYNEAGQLVEKVTADDEGVPESVTVFEYNDSRLVAEKETDAGGEVIAEKKFLYDENGYLAEQMEWNRENDFRIRTVDEWNEKGMRIRSARYVNGKLVERADYHPDDKGRVLRMTEENERGISTYRFEYDDFGNATLQEEQNGEGKVVSKIERAYDGEGRILENKVFIDGQGRRMSQYYRIEYIYEFAG